MMDTMNDEEIWSLCLNGEDPTSLPCLMVLLLENIRIHKHKLSIE
jgi:hypothetical protein